MAAAEQSLSKIVRDGFERARKDFDRVVQPLGFKRVKKSVWSRPVKSMCEFVYLHRDGSSYGAPLNASVDIRVHFAFGKSVATLALNGPSSDALRDSRGYAYHLRFNASSWSTYDRCIADLERVVKDHGLPWFAQRET